MSQLDQTSVLKERIAKLKWYHQIDFGNGVISPGIGKLADLKAQAEIYFRGGVAGKSVLDIGCWDGFNSIEAIRCGAERVLATDHWVWSNVPWASRKTIELASEYLAPSLEVMDIDLSDLSPERVGRFDVVLFCGVLYHLRHPFRGIEIAAALAKETLILETHLDAEAIQRPAAIFYPERELNGDPSNWWGPNRLCVEAMLKDVGMGKITYINHPTIASRGIFIATRG